MISIKKYFSFLSAVFFTVAIMSIFFVPTQSVNAAEVEKIHFLIPGGAGGGWDGTARGIGKALLDSKLIKQASFENMSGGGGGKAINHLISTSRRQSNTMMVNSTPIIIRSLQGVFPQSFHDLTPIAAVIADYAAFVVPKDSKYTTWNQVLADFKKDPNSVKIGGGSVKGGMDHLVPAMALKAAGEDPLKLKYIPYDAGGKAMAGLLSGDIKVLSTGVSEALGLARQGEVRILAITAPKRLAVAPKIPTLLEQGYDMTFANWRGLFGAPSISPEKADAFRDVLKKMYETPEWEDIRSKRGWQNLYKPGKEFVTFLEKQEKDLGQIMRQLGFLR